ncbi:hypothetical protein EDB86DRAFT_2831772 [Lactarius hatsudake]|nr:hypothetical protein EDB86DRAFT_2831772 [Lactarius hatsudake]
MGSSRHAVKKYSAYTRRKNGHGSHNPSSHSQRTSSAEELPRDNGQLATRRGQTSREAFVTCGKYLLRCVHPFISVDQLIYTAQEHMYPIDYTAISEETHSAYAVHWSAALMFSATLQKRVKQQDPEMKDVEQGLSEGIRNGRSSDAYRLKTNTAMLISKTKENLTLSRDSKSDRGFNHDTFGQLLIPIQHFTEYDSDPLGVRTKVNGSVKGYKVTAHDAPAFLYEDPSKYNSDDVLARFMRGYFLARCLRLIFMGPRTAIHRLRPNQKPSRTCVARLFNLESVSPSIVVYVAIQARFTLSSQQAWSSKDEDFDYEEFADNIFHVFDENEEWAEQTIRWWNMELFGKEDGSKLMGPTQANTSNGFLAKARAQTAKRHADEAAAEMAAADEAAADEAAADEAAADEAAADEAAADEAAADEAAADEAAADEAAADEAAADEAAADEAAADEAAADEAAADEAAADEAAADEAAADEAAADEAAADEAAADEAAADEAAADEAAADEAAADEAVADEAAAERAAAEMAAADEAAAERAAAEMAAAEEVAAERAAAEMAVVERTAAKRAATERAAAGQSGRRPGFKAPAAGLAEDDFGIVDNDDNGD